MPVPRPTLNLDAWAQFRPQERGNDYEYNLLLYKFRSLFSEVRDFCEAHSDCSVSQGSSSNGTSSTSVPINLNGQTSLCISDCSSPGPNNATSSSLSFIANPQPNNNNQDSDEFANYVNIDFFLKKNRAASFEGLEERHPNLEEVDDEEGDEDESEDEDSLQDSNEDTTQVSHSFSSDQLYMSELGGVSHRELAKKLSIKAQTDSSLSLTPSSSGDCLDDSQQQTHQTHLTRFAEGDCNLSSLASLNSHDSRVVNSMKNSIRDLNSSKGSPSLPSISLPVSTRKHSLAPAKQSISFDHGRTDKDCNALAEARDTMRSFLSDLNLSSVGDVFEDKAQRRIVKESFAVEFCGRRKLRHLFLFNDVIVCAKYQASSKQKFTFDVKWYLTLNGVSIPEPDDANNQVKYDREAIENQILAIRTNLMLLRGKLQHLKRSKHRQPSKVIKKLKKKRTELEAQLVLLLPHLPLVIRHTNGKKYIFFMSSNFDRNQWVDSIKFLQSQSVTSKGTSTFPSSSELQAWIQTCRKNLNPSLGTFLLRSNCDDDMLYGDLHLCLDGIDGIAKPGHYYFCFEVDSYGHFSQKASSPVHRMEAPCHVISEEHMFSLDGTHTLRILIYEDLGANTKPSLIGKAHIELNHVCCPGQTVEKVVMFNSECRLKTRFSYTSSELLSMIIPHTKLCPTFGIDITQVCKREKTDVPLLIQLCVHEVERRGMREVGIYRMSGTSTDVQRLRKAFETNPYVAELLLRDIDINSVTGFLKTYLREMPEGLFSNKLYLKFVAAFNIPQSESFERTEKMLALFHKIPTINQNTIIYLVEHLVRVNRYEVFNKMSLTNLATVLGPNILRPPSDTSAPNSSDPFTAVVIGSMSQAGILYFFLNRKFSKLPLTELDSSEIAHLKKG